MNTVIDREGGRTSERLLAAMTGEIGSMVDLGRDLKDGYPAYHVYGAVWWILCGEIDPSLYIGYLEGECRETVIGLLKSAPDNLLDICPETRKLIAKYSMPGFTRRL